MASAEAAGERRQSYVEERAMEAARFMLVTALELQKWSGYLDWSKRLAGEGSLRTPALIEAFSQVPRRDFLRPEDKADEGYDRPVEIDCGQTNSQPSLVANMLELLQPLEGQAILDVGAGSGWTTALLAAAVKDQGRVIGTERIAKLAEFGESNVSSCEFPWARIEHTPTGIGFPAEGPYDRILVSAHMLEEWLPELQEQLSPQDGAIVAPIATPANHGSSGYNQSIVRIQRNGDEFSSEVAVPGVSFVPLIKD